MSDVALKPRNYFEMVIPEIGVTLEFPSFTCVHCQRAVIGDPVLGPEVIAKLEGLAARRGFGGIPLESIFGFEGNRTCRACMALTCLEPGCATDCRNVYEVDGPLATSNVMWQPWLLRDERSFPVDRIYLADGSERLVRRRDNGMTERELARMAIPTPELAPADIRGRVHARQDREDEQAWNTRRERIVRP